MKPPLDVPASQLAAMTAFLGILTGALIAKGVLQDSELEEMVRLADRAVPRAGPNAAELLLAIRSGARLLGADRRRR